METFFTVAFLGMVPFYSSVKAYFKNDSEKINNYLGFWICMLVLILVETALPFVRSIYFYSVGRLVFAYWLSEMGGSAQVLTRCKPRLDSIMPTIDELIKLCKV